MLTAGPNISFCGPVTPVLLLMQLQLVKLQIFCAKQSPKKSLWATQWVLSCAMGPLLPDFVSRFFGVSKKKTARHRININLSRFEGESINGFIDPGFYSLSFCKT